MKISKRKLLRAVDLFEEKQPTLTIKKIDLQLCAIITADDGFEYIVHFDTNSVDRIHPEPDYD